MENLIGLLKIHVKRGINLAVRDVCSSDPYVIIQSGDKKLKTRVVKKNVNPEWDDALTFAEFDSKHPLILTVYDHDLFSKDDKMGEAEFDIGPYLKAIKLRRQLGGVLPNGTVIKAIQPSRENFLSEESQIVWNQGKLIQNIFLRLQNVESGEVEIQLEWIDTSGSRSV